VQPAMGNFRGNVGFNFGAAANVQPGYPAVQTFGWTAAAVSPLNDDGSAAEVAEYLYYSGAPINHQASGVSFQYHFMVLTSLRRLRYLAVVIAELRNGVTLCLQGGSYACCRKAIIS
jgi:hypothetical protein